ncbi:hypothetical protein Patl1_05644 [Pistacia atlantica]|uniref:Uncharacterized protein n=1 Tax=Pistacia atlantica TaxID=434234 RepID=A0ACC1BRS5_9ROSI|nr:hypothetical protein Patl1_05644 [Pistacia atlantica]
MALRATGYWRSMLNRLGGNHPFATSITPKMKQFAQSAGSAQANQSYNKFAMTGEFAPVYMVLGMLVVALTIGTHTAKQQLAHCPNVSVAHIQDNKQNLPNPTRPNPFTSPRNVETLKTAGANPSRS